MPVMSFVAVVGSPATFMSVPTPTSATSVMTSSDVEPVLGTPTWQIVVDAPIDCRDAGRWRIRRAGIAPLALAEAGFKLPTRFFSTASFATCDANSSKPPALREATSNCLNPT